MRCLDFLEDCERQGATIYADGAMDWYDLNIKIGDHLRLAIRPASAPIPEIAFGEGDVLASGIAKIISSCFRPDTASDSRFPMIQETKGACPKAEDFFGRWLEGLAAGKLVGGRVVTAPTTDPQKPRIIGIQKSVVSDGKDFGEKTFLLFEEVATANGVVLPIGSLLYARFATRGPYAGQQTAIESVGAIQGVSFLRLSGLCLVAEDDWQAYLGPETRHPLLNLQDARRVVTDFVTAHLIHRSS